jgi:D-glycero-D-manno-heptose 1,7-bisphosphate phosphatase
MRPAVFLDRDGVVNAAVVRDGHPLPPQSIDDVTILPGVREAIAAFKSAGVIPIVVTNQPDIARGCAVDADVTAINRLIGARTGIEHFVVCPHDDSDGCRCRKPLPGMILDAAAIHHVDLSHSVMVGDRWRDIEAGRAAGLATVLIERHYGERQADRPTVVVDELADAVEWIIQHTKGRTHDVSR